MMMRTLFIAAFALALSGGRTYPLVDAPYTVSDAVAKKSIMYVWTQRSCPACAAFWKALSQDAGFRAALLNRYRIVPVDPRRAMPQMNRRIRVVPAFLFDDRLLQGFSGADRFLARLGLQRETPKAGTPPVPAETNPRANDTRPPASALPAERTPPVFEPTPEEPPSKSPKPDAAPETRPDNATPFAPVETKPRPATTPPSPPASNAAPRTAPTPQAVQASSRRAQRTSLPVSGWLDFALGAGKVAWTLTKLNPTPIGIAVTVASALAGLLIHRRSKRRRRGRGKGVVPSRKQEPRRAPEPVPIPAAASPQPVTKHKRQDGGAADAVDVAEPGPGRSDRGQQQQGRDDSGIGVPVAVPADVEYRYVTLEVPDVWGNAYKEAVARFARADPGRHEPIAATITGMARAIHDGLATKKRMAKQTEPYLGWHDDEPAEMNVEV